MQVTMQSKDTLPLRASYCPISSAARVLTTLSDAAAAPLPSCASLAKIAEEGNNQRISSDERSRALFERNCDQQRLPSLLLPSLLPSSASSSGAVAVPHTFNTYLLPVSGKLWVDVYTDYMPDTGKRCARMVVKGANEEVQSGLIQWVSDRPDRKSINFRFYPLGDPHLQQPHLIKDSFTFDIPLDTQKIGFNGKSPITLNPR
jgi:hypothetical protein